MNKIKLNTFEKHEYILNDGWFFQICKLDVPELEDKYTVTIYKKKERKNFMAFTLTDVINKAYQFVVKENEYAELCTKCKCELNEIKKMGGFGV